VVPGMSSRCSSSLPYSRLLAPFPPNQQDLKSSEAQPSWLHPLGTDNLGRDQLSRIIFGSRIAIMVGVVAVTISGVFGMTLGLIAGYFGKWLETVIMRFMDALMAFPPIVLILAIAVLLGGGLFNVMIAVGIGMIPTYCRLMCGQILSAKESDYIRRFHGGQYSHHVPLPLATFFPALIGHLNGDVFSWLR
jgi:ABC-type dipeptide/oligopeptide/nickel transport system permease subunit